MKREHIFCGKRIDNGEWVYGALLTTFYEEDEESFAAIAYLEHNPTTGFSIHQCFNVHPESVGQFTGWTDVKEMRIWEGDVVRDTVMGTQFVVVYTDYGNFGLKPFYPAQAVEALKDFEYETVDSSYASTTLRVLGKAYDNAGAMQILG